MLHTDYDRKASVAKKKKTLVINLKGLGIKIEISGKPPVVN
jgi:hypothetical protein